MFALTDKSKETLMIDMLVGVVNDVHDREHHRFLEAPPEAHPPLGVGALTKEVTEVLCIWQWWKHPKVVIEQDMLEEVSEWR